MRHVCTTVAVFAPYGTTDRIDINSADAVYATVAAPAVSVPCAAVPNAVCVAATG